MILIFYNKCIQDGPQGAESFEKEKKRTLEQVTKICIAIVELFHTYLGLQCSSDTREHW